MTAPMRFQKPCGRPGCTGTVYARRPSEFARRRFCSTRCALLHRAPAFAAQAREMGRLGGIASAPKRRALASKRAAAHLVTLIPKEMQLRLGARDLACVIVLLTRAWRMGHRTHQSAERMQRTAERRRVA